MSEKKKTIKPQSERDWEMEKILAENGEREISKDEFLEAVKKASKKPKPKGRGK